MSEINIEYELGKIHAQLTTNDEQHANIIAKLDQIHGNLISFKEKIIEEHATLKTKVGFWGAIAGLFVSAFVAIISKFVKS